jgi:hypothetical protein
MEAWYRSRGRRTTLGDPELCARREAGGDSRRRGRTRLSAELIFRCTIGSIGSDLERRGSTQPLPPMAHSQPKTVRFPQIPAAQTARDPQTSFMVNFMTVIISVDFLKSLTISNPKSSVAHKSARPPFPQAGSKVGPAEAIFAATA